MKKTVLQIIPNLGAGGAEQACIDITAGLAGRGDTALVISAGGPHAAEVEKLGGRHYRLPVDSKNPLRIVKNALRLARFAREKKVDIIHARSRAPAWSAWLACRLARKPLVTTFHAAYKFSGKPKKLYNSVMVRGDRVIAISRFIAGHIAENYGIDTGKIRTINRGIDLEKFSPENVTEERRAALRKQWNVEEKRKIVFMPARLSPIKGHKLLLQALGLLQETGCEFHAIITGDDQGKHSYRLELEKIILAGGLGDKMGLFSHCSDMPAAYSIAEAVAVPSLVPEGFGRVAVEAMAMGVPVIASDLGAMRDTVQEGETGWLLSPSDPRAWAEAIARALALTPPERSAIARAAIARACAYFGSRRMVDETLAVYDEVLEERARCPNACS